MKLVLSGIQGSGKSTQGNLLSKQLTVPYLSTGHIFRQIAKEKTALGRYIKTVMNAGLLIPDEKTIEIVNTYLSRKEYHRGYILDGFPRTIAQAKHFKNNIDKFIYIDLPEKEALWRIAFRNDEVRDDENLEAIRKRIQLFYRHIKLVLKHYEEKGKLITVDGTKSIKEVNKEILRSLGKQIIKNQIKSWEQKKKAIIAIVGLSGSGKTETADFFAKEKKLSVISFGLVINEMVEKAGLPHAEEAHKKFRMSLRQKHGMEALAVLSHEKIKAALQKNTIIVIDGLYSWEEYIYLKKMFPDVRVYLLALYADKQVRYRRIARRKYRSKFYGEDRDVNELIGANKGAPIAYADFFVVNNRSFEELRDKLENVYRVVYYG